MPWVPESDPMTTVTEYGNFSVTVQYYEVVGYGPPDPETGSGGEEIIQYYPVTITSQLTDPSTISITGNGTLSATISGYYGPSFQEEITVMNIFDVNSETNTAMPTYQTFDTLNTDPKGIGVWQKFPSYNAFEVIKFDPNLTRVRDVYYNCVAKSGNTIISSTTKIIRIQDLNWTPGMEALNNAVNSLKRKK